MYPPKIKAVRIIDNPFDDIVPRITAEEKRTQQRAREKAQREREEEQRRRGAKKDVKLLSFGAEEGVEEEPVTFKKRPIVRPDLLEPEQPAGLPTTVPAAPKERLSKLKDSGTATPDPQSSKKSAKKDSEITKIREKHAQEKEAQSTARKTEIEKMEAEIRKLARRGGDESGDEPERKKAKKSYLEEEMAKYAKGRGAHKKGKRRDESDVLAALNSFRSKIKGAAPDETEGADPDVEMVDGEQPEQKAPGEDDPGVEVDDDTDFLTHALHFPKDNNEEVEKAERDYEVIDPRQRGARAREEERERKRAMKAKDGRRGYRR